MNLDASKELFAEASRYIPGGVNSPVRAFKAVGGNPIFMKSAKGAYLYDEDGNKYLDMINSWGPMILGHRAPQVEEAIIKAVEESTSFGTPGRREVEIAMLITEMMPSVEKVRMVNSGTEATMSAIRLARGFTGKDLIIKFEGCYHGHGDSFLIAAGSGAITMGTPDSPGVTSGTAKDTLLAPYNDLIKVEELIHANQDKIAAIIIEPVGGNMGCVLPEEGFLEGLRKLCDQHSIILVFDEVMTGFRLAKGGAQELFDVKADLTTLGKIIGGGMPVGAYGGKREIMDFVSPSGPVYQAGTLSGNPVAMAAGIATLSSLNSMPSVFENLNLNTQHIVDAYQQVLNELGLDYTINQVGSMFSLFFTNQRVTNFESAKSSDTVLFGKYFRSMLESGIYLAPSQFETLFVSNCIGATEIELLKTAHKTALEAIIQ